MTLSLAIIIEKEGNGMGLIKIGKYIAEKRKGLGLTQKQLAEKLGMSDKSVSKWERGVCLPDVSVYMELCEILGISINEFFAGEDICKENVIKKSEDNLIQVTKDSQYKQKSLKGIILILILALIVTGISLGIIMYDKYGQSKNYIAVSEPDSAEVKIAELLSGVDGVFLFPYYTEEEFENLTIYMSEYYKGELKVKSVVAEFSYEGVDSTEGGMIVFQPNFESCTINLVVTDNYINSKSSISILENEENRAYFGRSATQIKEDIQIEYDTEQGLIAFIYGENGISLIPIEEIENEEFKVDNDYVYYFTVEFEKNNQ